MPGTWQSISNQPFRSVQRMLLLTDGSILCHTGGATWAKYKPDEFGQYTNGTWEAVDSMRHARIHFGALTLPDGRVMVIFGKPEIPGRDASEPRRLDPTVEFFNPNERPGRQWTMGTSLPAFDPVYPEIRQTCCCLLADGRRVLVGTDLSNRFVDPRPDNPVYLYDLVTNTWTLVDRAENGRRAIAKSFTLLPDENVFTSGCYRNAHIYAPDAGIGRWNLTDIPSFSVTDISQGGTGVLLTDGRVWIVHRSLNESLFYIPSARNGVVGPELPTAEFMGISFDRFAACVLPNGKVFFTGSHISDGHPEFYEYTHNGADNIFTLITPPVGLPTPRSIIHQGAYLLLLPTGEAMMSFLSQMFVYTPATSDPEPHPEWRPTLNFPLNDTDIVAGATMTARGLLFNGMTQAVFHNPGKSTGTATNFPIIRLTNRASGRTWYCRTSGHSSMGVATGIAAQHTNFRIPDDVELGRADLCIIANGITGDCVEVMVRPRIEEIVIPPEIWQLIGNLADGPLIVIGPHGPMPVPPFGPLVENEQIFRERVVEAYKHIFSGLLQMNSALHIEYSKQGAISTPKDADTIDIGIQKIQSGLAMLRLLGHQSGAD